MSGVSRGSAERSRTEPLRLVVCAFRMAQVNRSLAEDSTSE